MNSSFQIRRHEFVERQFLKACTRKQKIIARSSAEAELCAAALGASEAKSVERGMGDLGFVVKPVLIIDAEATEDIQHRHGLGKMKHIDAFVFAGLIQIEQVESPPRQERRQSCGHRDESAQH